MKIIQFIECKQFGIIALGDEGEMWRVQPVISVNSTEAVIGYENALEFIRLEQRFEDRVRE